ncbi:MAG: LysM peptidoglycan-binding domain-containing protein [Anaerolineae bacterium]|nr:LysM peptidoglycan-binding domain-containing protein [Anaerolineae bacterium]MDK1081793.1 LysM peptidoglycan-binding domain-containing protein [Anaerolineae bacterium]
MSPENSKQNTQVCPTCGTRLSQSATRCLVCGTELSAKAVVEKKATKKVEKSVQATRMPEITLGLPAALGFIAVILLIGAGLVYGGLSLSGAELQPSPVPTATETSLPTATATEVPTNTPVPTPTELPPFDYTIAAGDTCSLIALNFGISVNSLIILNNLPVACNNLYIGQVVKVPYATVTPAPLPTNTLPPEEQAIVDCEKVSITVQENDTLSSISLNYAVPMTAIKEYNGLSTDSVFLGQGLLIPLCERAATPGPSPTPTNPPPYAAPSLLLPADGGAFTLANDVVTLQWSSVGTLEDNEIYRVIVEDITAGQARRLTEYETDTKFIVPTTFRPNDNVAHVFRWRITTVRQTGTDEQGQPIYTSAGADSLNWVFTWVGSAPQETPEP